jgi:outer membrane biosynthesis protein TonB
MKRLLFVVLLAGLSSACAAAQAKAPADRPTLVVPEPPPRMIDNPPEPEPASADPVGEAPPASPVPPPKSSRPAPSRETPRTEPKPPETPPVEQPATPTVPAPVPAAPQLRPPGAGNGPEAAKQVRDLIDRAKKGLDSVDYRHLNTAQQGQYNTAKLMLTNAEDHLKGSNFDIARELADKANRIATELQGR